jgi:very-short-patch-repair endonuclease
MPVLLTKTQLYARALRRNTTDAEKLLWSKLRREQLGAKFRRQHPIAPYIVDFICVDRRLIIELDGSQHMEKIPYDSDRDQFLARQRYTVLRFWNNEVFENLNGVLTKIDEQLAAARPTLTLPASGEGTMKNGESK